MDGERGDPATVALEADAGSRRARGVELEPAEMLEQARRRTRALERQPEAADRDLDPLVGSLAESLDPEELGSFLVQRVPPDFQRVPPDFRQWP